MKLPLVFFILHVSDGNIFQSGWTWPESSLFGPNIHSRIKLRPKLKTQENTPAKKKQGTKSSVFPFLCVYGLGRRGSIPISLTRSSINNYSNSFFPIPHGCSWSITPMMYPFSFMFKEASTAYVVLIILNLFLGMTPTIATLILQQFPDDSVS